MDRDETTRPPTVRFTTSDGFQPSRSGPGKTFNIKMPMAITIPPNGQVHLRLGVSCDRPVILIQDRIVRAKGIRIVPDGLPTVDADVEIETTVWNTTDDPVMLEEGDRIVRCSVLDDSVLGMD